MSGTQYCAYLLVVDGNRYRTYLFESDAEHDRLWHESKGARAEIVRLTGFASPTAVPQEEE